LVSPHSFISYICVNRSSTLLQEASCRNGGTDCQSTRANVRVGETATFNQDVVCCNTDQRVRLVKQRTASLKCLEITEKMFTSVQVPKKSDAKPDIITAISVLNACAEDVETAAKNAAIMNVAVQILEISSRRHPTFGRPTLPTPTPLVH
jgi:hypothetical protein